MVEKCSKKEKLIEATTQMNLKRIFAKRRKPVSQSSILYRVFYRACWVEQTIGPKKENNKKPDQQSSGVGVRRGM